MKRGWVKGQPLRYCHGHAGRKPVRWIEQDCGYTSPCWIWQLATATKTGYGLTKREGRGHPAHRVVYEQFRGPIPEGLVIDHLCRVRNCVNPDHLEPVTHAENCRRGRRDSPTWGRVGDPPTELFCQIVGDLARGLPQSVIATEHRVSPSYVSLIARGKRGPTGKRKP